MDWKVILFGVYQVIVILTIIHVVLDNRQPAKTMAWALVIWFVPVVGIVFYLFFGVNTRKERLISQRSLDMLSKRSMLEFVEQRDLRLPEEYKPIIDLFVSENFSLPFKGSEVKIHTDGYSFFHALLKEIASAKDHIHLDMYIFEDDALGNMVRDALVAKTREGVEVRLIYDDVGCWNVSNRFFERMREEGIEVAPFLPVRFPSFTSKVNYRNHRKMIVIDGRTGFIGGMNIALRYVKGTKSQPWRDTMLQITGSGVYSLQRAFLVDWYFVDRNLISNRKYYPHPSEESSHNESLLQIVTSGPDTPYPEIMQGYVRMILAAKKYIYIETPYFLPTDPVLFALKTAAAGGVDVRILVPLRSDTKFVEWAGRSYLREMVKAGVSVSYYMTGFLHSKMIVCDDAICSCGSTNVDFRSFENNFESNAFIYDTKVAIAMRDIFLEDTSQSLLFTDMPQRVKPNILKRLVESLVRLMSPLM
ncbi:MAG: cardiolipin synthase [Prevotella sp.]|nr:cardiolipin synthase [Prevotella sp.]